MTVSDHEVVVTGLGLVTPAGTDVESTWQRVCDGASTAAPDPVLAGLPVSFSCRVDDDALAAAAGPRLAWRADRFIRLALAAAKEAARDAALDPSTCESTRVGVLLGVSGSSQDHTTDVYAAIAAGRYRAVTPTAVPRCSPNMAAGEVARALGVLGPTMSVSTACASGTTAVGMAALLIRTGLCDMVVTGGCESACAPVGAVTFWRMGALASGRHDPAASSRPFDADRDGFVLAEGAGVLVLERAGHARARGARAYARLAGYGATSDAHHPTAPHPEGLGTQQAFRIALAEAGLLPSDIDHVNAHATSTLLNDRIEAAALRAVFGSPPPVTATKSVLGHALGGAGAIEAVCSVLSLHHQLIPPTANLDRMDPEIDLDVVTKQPRSHRMNTVASNSSGFGGQNAVVIFQHP
ncbi:beta-ketoacyl-[acyl-carrier-protein] synthase family protein [Streptomyces sp. NPDC047028]|uniref:beta-ketoacyl-[acyl-carrier-protein] synthase family protein n=1 Tax=Streptomyces sp. NPDC047028 TaxID=3155793 RepID=UPI0033E36EC0